MNFDAWSKTFLSEIACTIKDMAVLRALEYETERGMNASF